MGILVDAIKISDLSSFHRDLEKAIEKQSAHKTSSFISVGVEDTPHHSRQKVDGYSRGLINKGGRTVTCAQVAAAHEFGIRVPKRSFLETSVLEFLKGKDFKELKKRKYVYLTSFFKVLCRKIYSMIITCFITNGFGKWSSLTDDYKRKTGRTEPALLDTGQLMAAVYVRYSGFTIKGNQISGNVQIDRGAIITGYVEEDTTKKESKLNKLKSVFAELAERHKKTKNNQEDIDKTTAVMQEQKNTETKKQHKKEYLENTLIDRLKWIEKEKDRFRKGYIKQVGEDQYNKHKKTLEVTFTKMATESAKKIFK